MSFPVVREPGLRVAGVLARTTNLNPERIGELWRQFHDEGVAGKLRDRVDENIYSVYANYENDAWGEFDVVVGCAVGRASILPEELAEVAVEEGTYAVFEVTGAIPEGMVKVWSEIWATPLQRRFRSDFEVYRPDGTITVHIGVS